MEAQTRCLRVFPAGEYYNGSAGGPRSNTDVVGLVAAQPQGVASSIHQGFRETVLSAQTSSIACRRCRTRGRDVPTSFPILLLRGRTLGAAAQQIERPPIASQTPPAGPAMVREPGETSRAGSPRSIRRNDLRRRHSRRAFAQPAMPWRRTSRRADESSCLAALWSSRHFSPLISGDFARLPAALPLPPKPREVRIPALIGRPGGRPRHDQSRLRPVLRQPQHLRRRSAISKKKKKKKKGILHLS